jgi:hypothetical protein
MCCGTGLPGRKLSVEAVKRDPPAWLAGSGGGRGGPRRTPGRGDFGHGWGQGLGKVVRRRFGRVSRDEVPAADLRLPLGG